MNTLSAQELHEQGVRYYNGNGVKKDVKKAIECFEQAIASGNLPQSKRVLGSILLSPSYVSQLNETDMDRGTELLMEAADEGDMQAMIYVVNTFGALSYQLLSLLALLCFQFKTYSMMRKRIKLARKCKKELTAP